MIKELKVKHVPKINLNSVFPCSICSIQVKAGGSGTAVIAFVSFNEVIFIDIRGHLTWGSKEYLFEAYHVIKDITEDVRIEVD